MNIIYDLHRMMASEKLILVYQGEITQETTKSILSIAERSLEAAEEDAGIKRKVFNVMVESLQNMVRHNDALIEDGRRTQSGIFLISREPDRYTIMSGNPTHKSRVTPLRAKLQRINELTRDGLKDLYKQIIKGTQISDKGGAGLGFVDMARKSGEKLWFDFPEISGDYCLFCLKINVARELH